MGLLAIIILLHFFLYLQCFDRVIGVELIPSAVENAKMNAKENG